MTRTRFILIHILAFFIREGDSFQWLALGMSGTASVLRQQHQGVESTNNADNDMASHRPRSLDHQTLTLSDDDGIQSRSAALRMQPRRDMNSTELASSADLYEWTSSSDERWLDTDYADTDVVASTQSPGQKPVKTKKQCKLLLGLTRRQIRVCRQDVEHMDSVRAGAHLALVECQWQFRQRRWNCTPTDSVTIFGTTLANDTREAAFVNAIASAGVAQQVTRDCSRGHLDKCGCDMSPVLHGQPPKGFRWDRDGCSDNIHYGVAFSRRFLDDAERAKRQPLVRTLQNLRNIEAGRQAVVRNMRPRCKCHGVSGSCTIKSCALVMPSFREVGDILKDRFDAAAEVRLVHTANGQRAELQRRHVAFKEPNESDLVYSESSPDYCQQRADASGRFVTSGRRCNATSLGIDGCDLLCCHRGYDTKMINRLDTQCTCKFVYCCRVECEPCKRQEFVHTCR